MDEVSFQKAPRSNTGLCLSATKPIPVVPKSSCPLREFHTHAATLKERYTNSKSVSLRQAHTCTTQVPHHERTSRPAVRSVTDWPCPSAAVSQSMSAFETGSHFSQDVVAVATHQGDSSQGHVFLRTLPARHGCKGPHHFNLGQDSSKGQALFWDSLAGWQAFVISVQSCFFPFFSQPLLNSTSASASWRTHPATDNDVSMGFITML